MTLIPGDGIGPEICDSMVGIFQAAGLFKLRPTFITNPPPEVPIKWEKIELRENDSLNFQEIVASISRNRVAVKGPIYTPVLGSASRNLQLRKALGYNTLTL